MAVLPEAVAGGHAGRADCAVISYWAAEGPSSHDTLKAKQIDLAWPSLWGLEGG